jgi:hypothetical protein
MRDFASLDPHYELPGFSARLRDQATLTSFPSGSLLVRT